MRQISVEHEALSIVTKTEIYGRDSVDSFLSSSLIYF